MINQGVTLHSMQPQGKLCVNIDQLVATHFIQTPSGAPKPVRTPAKKSGGLLGWIRRSGNGTS